MASKIIGVDDRCHAESLTGMKEGDVVYNRELDAKMVLRGGKWVTFTSGGKKSAADRLKGFVFCLTGKMWTTRQDIEQRIKNCGGKIARTANTSSTILVCGTAVSSSQKREDGKANGCQIVDHRLLKKVLEGAVQVERAFMSGEKVEAEPIETIDRERRQEIVKQTLADIDSIAFGK